ncbi:hypothetical protein I203_104663 [Kwoniella mangroviensis CBS 8507]|uniref:uncharacterized protein n=1 Tax=Kwoniella mangroviensis CBS 8507 TaxID=1296122 RepID=UPI00080D7233|nr:uncharacterized protein I203_00391 [Kwoniella mangroviensis CBS 8507]OCF70259.1 hypothetical protein I203_00391 [Kwoniella mangroviensis CBS 8507]
MSTPIDSIPPADASEASASSSASALQANGLADQPQPSTSTLTPAPASGAEEINMEEDGGIKVYKPISESTTPTSKTEPDESFFEPTLADVQSHHSSVLARNKRLNEAPLLTAKYREAEKAEREKLKKDRWPNTTIRIKFSDGTIIQNIFPSDSPIQPVYEFIRTALIEEVISEPFILYQPPRTKYPEYPIPIPSSSTQSKSKSKPTYAKSSIITPANYGPVKGGTLQGLQGGTGGKETLYELGLVPQSVLLVRWEDDEAMNASSYPAPIQGHLKAKSQPLPPSVPRSDSNSTNQQKGTIPGPGQASAGPGEKKIPKWLQKGLLKKKT